MISMLILIVADHGFQPWSGIILIPNLSVFNTSLLNEAPNTNVIGFGLARPRLEPMICHNQDEHANHYTTDVA
jgi:hypothetical protein